MNTTDESITRLLEQLPSQEQEVVQPLYERTVRRLQAIAGAGLRAGVRGGLIQETQLAHDAFLNLIKRSDGPRTTDAFYSAASGVIHDRIVDHVRWLDAQKRRATMDATTNVEQLQAKESRFREVVDVVEKLRTDDPEAALVLEYYSYLGLRRDEIARLLSLTEHQVRSALSRAREQFQESWVGETLE